MAHLVAMQGNRCEEGFFSPHEGRVPEATQNNVESANQGKFSILFPWLETNTQEEQNNLPVTGSNIRLALFDRFHESNTCSRVEWQIDRRMTKNIGCATCAEAFVLGYAEKDHAYVCSPYARFLERRNNGGLIVTSYGVLQVLRYAEKIFRLRVESEKGMKISSEQHLIRNMTNDVLLIHGKNIRNFFPDMPNHRFDDEPVLMDDHLTQIIKKLFNKKRKIVPLKLFKVVNNLGQVEEDNADLYSHESDSDEVMFDPPFLMVDHDRERDIPIEVNWPYNLICERRYGTLVTRF
eukprot:gene5791-11080_t